MMGEQLDVPSRIQDELREAVDVRDFERALSTISTYLGAAKGESNRTRAFSLGSIVLDSLCLEIGEKIRRSRASRRLSRRRRSPPVDIYVASRLYVEGGHTPLIGDFIRAAGRPARLLITNLYNDFEKVSPEILRRAGLDASHVAVAPRSTLLDKLHWLFDQLDDVNARRIFLFNHPEDCAAVAACQRQLTREVTFVHHADHSASIGVFIPFARHVDVTPYCFSRCAVGRSKGDHSFIPLVAEDIGPRSFAGRSREPAPLVTASAGSRSKFRLDYSPNYIEVVSRLLAATGGHHVHIGALPPPYLERFRTSLAQHDVRQDRLLYVEHVSSLWTSMETFGVDLYIGSFPERGARASVEVMGSATPALWHVESDATFFRDTHMRYPEALTWRSVDELIGTVRSIDGDWLRAQSGFARRHYERLHHPRIMASSLHSSWPRELSALLRRSFGQAGIA